MPFEIYVPSMERKNLKIVLVISETYILAQPKSHKTPLQVPYATSVSFLLEAEEQDVGLGNESDVQNTNEAPGPCSSI